VGDHPVDPFRPSRISALVALDLLDDLVHPPVAALGDDETGIEAGVGCDPLPGSFGSLEHRGTTRQDGDPIRQRLVTRHQLDCDPAHRRHRRHVFRLDDLRDDT